MEQFVFEVFCRLYPHEMYELHPEEFWQYFHGQCPNVSREKMVELLGA